jgi:succinate-semialdehyde dehydrogenase/glutarate-semialdehyde dehydrogenase
MSYPNTQLHIFGKWEDAEDGRSIPVLNPTTNREIGYVAHASTADLDRALAAAQTGFESWRSMTAFSRSKIMREAAVLFRERVEATSRYLTQEQGKPLAEARAECLAAADIIEWFAEEGIRVYGRIVPSRTGLNVRQMVVKDPVGPVAAFTPWNFPINQTVRKVCAALATGCSIIVKGPEETPAAPAALIRAFVDAGIQPGVVNLVYGNPAEISTYLIESPIIRKVTFTGSTIVGKQLAALAGQYMKRVTMELGGHAPVIVCEDADIDLAVKTAGAAKFRNAGQVCISPTRFLVHESVHKRFASALASHAESLRVGDGLEEDTQMGPLANARRIDTMEALTEDARQSGADVLAGGRRTGSVGNFWQATVIDNVPTTAAVFRDEPFGPIAAVRPFNRLEEAIAEANMLPYGLAGYAFTSSLRNSDLLARHLEVGMLWVNMASATSAELPFGGLKDSGYGSEGGPEALEQYLNTRAITFAHV